MKKKKRKKYSTYDELISGYYGNFHHHHSFRKKTKAVSVAKSLDDGEVIVQKKCPKTFDEYVVQSSVGNGAFEEYVTTKSIFSTEQAEDIKFEMLPGNSTAMEEWQVDVLNPLEQQPTPYAHESSQEVIATVTKKDDAQPAEYAPEVKAPSVTDDHFVADLQSILSGEKMYDPVTQSTVSKEQLRKRQQPVQEPQQDQQDQQHHHPEFSNQHAIFDEIKKSLEYANAYDIGTVELENRFDNFDKIFEYEENTAKQKKEPQPEKRQQAETEYNYGDAEFIQDLDTIHQLAKASEVTATPAETTQPAPTGEQKSPDPAAELNPPVAEAKEIL